MENVRHPTDSSICPKKTESCLFYYIVSVEIQSQILCNQLIASGERFITVGQEFLTVCLYQHWFTNYFQVIGEQCQNSQRHLSACIIWKGMLLSVSLVLSKQAKWANTSLSIFYDFSNRFSIFRIYSYIFCQGDCLLSILFISPLELLEDISPTWYQLSPLCKEPA